MVLIVQFIVRTYLNAYEFLKIDMKTRKNRKAGAAMTVKTDKYKTIFTLSAKAITLFLAERIIETSKQYGK
jgi:hypothetical protein